MNEHDYPPRHPNDYSPTVYEDSEGNQFADFCRLGTETAAGQAPSFKKCCNSFACACQANESPLKPVPPDVAKDFWLALDHYAASAASKW